MIGKSVEPSSETPSPKDAQVVGGLAAVSRDDLIQALREAIKEPSLARKAEVAYFASVNRNWREPLTCVDPLVAALAVLLPERDSSFQGSPHEANEAKIAAAVKALEAAEEWLSGWASAEPYLTTIRITLSSLKEGK